MKLLYSICCVVLLSITSCNVAQTPVEPSKPESVYLFSYFKGNGEDGVHFAFSNDGIVWKALKNDTAFLAPKIGSKLMRDPSICQGPDGMFHMVWTTGWQDNCIGLAHSKDLIHWSEQQFLPVMGHEPTAKNCWAPEIFYDTPTKTYLICWSTTIPGRFPETEIPKGSKNHRIYCITTKNFKTFTDTRLFYDPGFNVIDAFIAYDKVSKRYVMFLKNETKEPKAEKNIRIAFSDKAEGPYGKASESITGQYWAEGPAVLVINGRWFVYVDRYMDHCYGAVVSDDLKHWQDISDEVHFPKGAHHGTMFEITPEVLEKLQAQ